MAKLTIQFDDDINKLLEKLASKKSTTKAEIIRRALTAYQYLDEETSDEDKRVSVRSIKDKKFVTDVILP